jgi:hypothetical protein
VKRIDPIIINTKVVTNRILLKKLYIRNAIPDIINEIVNRKNKSIFFPASLKIKNAIVVIAEKNKNPMAASLYFLLIIVYATNQIIIKPDIIIILESMRERKNKMANIAPKIKMLPGSPSRYKTSENEAKTRIEPASGCNAINAIGKNRIRPITISEFTFEIFTL